MMQKPLPSVGPTISTTANPPVTPTALPPGGTTPTITNLPTQPLIQPPGTGAVPPGMGAVPPGVGAAARGIGAVPPGMAGIGAIPAGATAGPAAVAVPDPGQTYRSWYPRWWFLAALFCFLALGIVQIFQALPCQGASDFAATRFCQVTSQATSWMSWEDPVRQILVLAAIWLVYFLTWIATFTFGMVPIQIKRSREAVPHFLRLISEFRTVASLFYVYASGAILTIFIMFFTGHTPTMAFALCSIVLFIANSYFFHKQTRAVRLQYLVGYGLLALLCIGVMCVGVIWFSQRWQYTLLAAEIVVGVVGIWAIVALVREPRTATTAPNLTPEQILDAINAQALEPGEVFRAWVRSLRPGK